MPTQPQFQPRPLVPAGDVAGPGLTTHALISSTESGGTPTSSVGNAARHSKKNASMACEACKVSKRKVGSRFLYMDAGDMRQNVAGLNNGITTPKNCCRFVVSASPRVECLQFSPL